MLHINTAFTRDPEANAFIREFINDRITSELAEGSARRQGVSGEHSLLFSGSL